MFKAVIFFVLDILFIKITVAIWDEAPGQINGYLILCAAFVAWFTWEFVRAIKEWLE